MANVFRLHADAVGILEDKIFGIMDDRESVIVHAGDDRMKCYVFPALYDPQPIYEVRQRL